jgi:hypothetical protein
MLASIKSTNINTQQINSTQSIKYKTDKLNKAKIIKKTKTKQKSLKKLINVNINTFLLYIKKVETKYPTLPFNWLKHKRVI